ncbi:hypothetical protein ASPWEDRAFT_29255 [Aspergillus wentii DTO 134E9]|uniref:Phosphoribosylaminoimidazole-succinocarboxamide synthase n=1 Tax=Aspergillus wentii DTO 134E9 TaxID=1073089 RepID=A0A1L9RGM7_ASPWE|nr:uncharacterized protein ASPWEDRAFT_29255 [Aspergillus wentii DTO 134E9]KAI9927863.1 hypothetical protein MW887_002715 [Aspergillus wentii]OJJ34082.1 hypothetical protein ASPWEDRAFT_29255 [Aspergillus wentii DTO 134E9]
MNNLRPSNLSLRTVSSNRPQLHHTEDQRSVAASDDYYSFSDHNSSRSPSNGSAATVMRYATPASYPPSRTASPHISRTHLAPDMAAPEAERSAPQQDGTPTSNTVHFGQDRVAWISPRSDHDSHQDQDLGEYSGRPDTPGLDDSPYVRFAINQLTRDEETASLSRKSSLESDEYPADRLVWDEGLGQFTRSPLPSKTPPAQQPRPLSGEQQQLLPPPPQSVEPESFVAVEPPEESLLYPALDYVPVVLRPWALAALIFCCLLMIAGIVFCNVWSRRHSGLWYYDGQGGSQYFVFQFLPQILAAIITIWTFVVQAAIYRIMPFATMGSERPVDHVLQKLPILSQNFLLPDISHFRHGEPAIGISLFAIWLSNFISIPLLSCLFQAKWYDIDGQGTWQWASVLAVGWTLVAIYGLLVIGLLMLMLRFARTWSGLMWDPTSLADLISIIQRSNILHDFEYSEVVPHVGETLDPRVLRLGYWRLSNRDEIFYGVGEVDAPIRSPSLHRTEKTRGKQPHGLLRVSFDVEQHAGFSKEMDDHPLYSKSARYRWTPWFLRDTWVVLWSVIVSALFIAFVLASFIHDAIKGGFPPRLPTLPSTGAFSSSNFLYSFIPALIGNVLFLLWQPVDVYFRGLQPFVELSAPNGAPAERSLLLSYPARLPFEVTVLAILNKHYKVAWISLMSVVSVAIPILAGGVFIALWYPSHQDIRIAALMPAFYTLVAFCALYMVSFLCIWPRRCRYLPHDISTVVDQISFLYQSPLLSDKLLREPRSKTDLVTRLIMAPPGERDYPMYGFGIYIGRDGKEHLGIDRFHRPGRSDMLITTGSMK